jgi:hypothetical protein
MQMSDWFFFLCCVYSFPTLLRCCLFRLPFLMIFRFSFVRSSVSWVCFFAVFLTVRFSLDRKCRFLSAFRLIWIGLSWEEAISVLGMSWEEASGEGAGNRRPATYFVRFLFCFTDFALYYVFLTLAMYVSGSVFVFVSRCGLLWSVCGSYLFSALFFVSRSFLCRSSVIFFIVFPWALRCFVAFSSLLSLRRLFVVSSSFRHPSFLCCLCFFVVSEFLSRLAIVSQLFLRDFRVVLGIVSGV